MSAATASASTIVVTLGSCADASKQIPFELSADVNTPLPANGGPFCSVRVDGASSDLVQDAAQCSIFVGNTKIPVDVASPLAGPYKGNTPVSSILCSANSADQPSGALRLGGRGRLDAVEPDRVIPNKKRAALP